MEREKGKRKMYILSYADDIVLMAKEEQGMRSMLSRLERHLERKGLELNEEKTKVMRFNKGGGRKKKVEREEIRGDKRI